LAQHLSEYISLKWAQKSKHSWPCPCHFVCFALQNGCTVHLRHTLLLSPANHLLCLQTLITGVSQVGVDINAMVANPWRQGPLQFVPGLGPRKARALLAAIAASEDPFVKNRVDLLKQVCVCVHLY
jgi:hypothetical protein